MAKKLFLAFSAFIIILLSSCNRDDLKATVPAYLSISDLNLITDYPTEGTAHNKITTVWVEVNGEPIGAFDLPCLIPVIGEEEVEVEIIPGISMNGIDASRAIYLPYESIIRNVVLKPLDTVSLQTTSPINFGYASTANITIIEDFDQTGQNLVAHTNSDTVILKTNKSNEVFINPNNTEDNEKAGVLTLAGDDDFFELRTINNYSLPKGSRSVFLEMSYRNDIPLVVGVIAITPAGSFQAQTVQLNTQEDWNKIYINLVTEISAYPSATGFRIFVGGFKSVSTDTARVYLDNLKIVY